MSGVWKFHSNGVIRLIENPDPHGGQRKKVLVYTDTNEVITCYSQLEKKLSAMGWERYYEDDDLLQFHKRSSIDLISLPKDFKNFKSMHMYDIVVKNRNRFQVRDTEDRSS